MESLKMTDEESYKFIKNQWEIIKGIYTNHRINNDSIT